jgi:branched-chain amino acid transport system substrate-binding protein
VRKLIYGGMVASLLNISPLMAAETIKIGIAGPMSGPYAAFGDQLWNGASQAAVDINNQGGINGSKIELIKADDACEPKQAVSVAHRLVNEDKVSAVIGHFCSSSTLPASQIYADENIVMITPASTNPMITERGLKSIFRACGRDDQQGKVAADYIYNNLKAKRVAVVHDKDTYGKGLADAMKAQIEKLGSKVVVYEGLTRGDKNFNALVTKIKDTKADAVYFGGLHTEAGPLVRQLREQGVKVPFISGDGIVSEDFVTEAGGPQIANGVLMTFGPDPRDFPEGKKVIEEFHQNKIDPEGYTLYSYASLQAILEAMKQTQSTDGKKLADWLHHNTVHTVMGDRSWDDKGDMKNAAYVMFQWDDKGKYHPVKN